MTDWMTQQQAAAYLKCSPRQLRRLPLTHNYLGRLPRYDREDLDEYMARKRVVHRQKRRVALRLAAHVVGMKHQSDEDWHQKMKALLKAA